MIILAYFYRLTGYDGKPC